ncbi:MAG TPA: hypothetical protein VEK34_07455 [Methylocella sp.]|nr:hypothetical protein [Methylocella sp.]
MVFSRTAWAAGVLAPWCLALALVVSMSASAGQDGSFGASTSPRPLRMRTAPVNLIIALAPLDLAALPPGTRGLLQQASLSAGNDEDFHRLPDEIEPRLSLKHNARQFPTIDRSRRGDPIIGLRPEFDSRLPASQGLTGG